MDGSSGVIIKESKIDKGVFANKDFKKGEEIFQFCGPIIIGNDNIAPDSYTDNHCVQIGEDMYIGPSGGPDDYINHSCDPNGSFNISDNKASIIALKNIAKGEEITFDYSTSMAEDRYEINCSCGAGFCRQKIRDFKYLPAGVQREYTRLNAVPEFVLDSI